MARTRPCFRLVAADLPEAIDGDRDTAIAKNIRRHLQDGSFVIGLFGSLHVARGLRYHALPDFRNVADQLEEDGFSIKSVAQDWQQECHPDLKAPQGPEAATFLATIGHTINGTVLRQAVAPIDAVQVWCR